MSQTFCERCSFPAPMRWLHAGGDLSQPNHIHQCTDHTLMRSEHQPKMPSGLARPRVCADCSWRRPGVPSIIDIGAGIKSP
jgi:hypothetical protein